MSQLFTAGGQSIWASSSASIPLMNIQDWFPLGLTGLIFLQSKGLSRVFSNTTVQKHQFFDAQPSLWSNTHIHIWLLEKVIALTIQTFVGKVMSLLFNLTNLGLSNLYSKEQVSLISWLQSLSAVILEPNKIKSATVSIEWVNEWVKLLSRVRLFATPWTVAH